MQTLTRERRVEVVIRRAAKMGLWMQRSKKRLRKGKKGTMEGPWSQYRDDELCALAEGWAFVEEMTPEERQRATGKFPLNGPLKESAQRADLLRELVGRLKRERRGPRVGGL